MYKINLKKLIHLILIFPLEQVFINRNENLIINFELAWIYYSYSLNNKNVDGFSNKSNYKMNYFFLKILSIREF